jgi:L-ribulose-5-phosphate 3-epimerase
MRQPSRREFLKSSFTAACAAGFSSTTAGRSSSTIGVDHAAIRSPASSIKKGVLFDMLPTKLSYAERFKMARDVGFDVVQVPTEPDPPDAERIKKAADDANMRIDSVMNMNHWKYPLSSSDSTVVEQGLAGMRVSLYNAKLWGSDAVLIVPAIVNPKTSYLDAWTRSQTHIRTLIPLAEELRVVIAIEEVWNRFLLSPLEMAKYIDEFHSPWIKSWFDVGNVMLWGYPQDWIYTLDKRIAKVHLKDFKLKNDEYAWVNLGDGDVDWRAVREAFAKTGYTGSAIVELHPGDEAYLRGVSRRVDRLLLGRS